MAKLTRNSSERRAVRKFRIRKNIQGTTERPRLVVSKSLKFLSAQIIDDSTHTTIVGGSSKAIAIEKKIVSAKNLDIAKQFGEFIGEQAIAKGIKTLVFDRNGYLYHGKIKAFADGVRSKGINF